MLPRLSAALFSALAALLTAAFVVFMYFDQWRPEQRAFMREWAVLIALSGAVFGLLAGPAAVAALWGGVWGTDKGETGLFEFLALLVLVGSLYGAWRYFTS